MPGFRVAKKAAAIHDADPSVEGLILLKHGIFTFGHSALEAYEGMIEMVSLAEARLRRGRKAVFATTQLPPRAAAVAEVAPIVGGTASREDENIEGALRRPVSASRTATATPNYA